MLNYELVVANIIEDKSFNFAVNIVNMIKNVRLRTNEYILTKQLLRSATSIGANVSEALCAVSDRDFVSKMAISNKEVRETLYWIKLLYKTEYLTKVEYDGSMADANELAKILTSIIKTKQENINKSQFKIKN